MISRALRVQLEGDVEVVERATAQFRELIDAVGWKRHLSRLLSKAPSPQWPISWPLWPRD